MGATRMGASQMDATQIAGAGTGRTSAVAEEPRRIGRFAVLRVLGAGGMGVVYVAYDEELDRRVAIKLLQARAGVDTSQGHTRLLREAQAMAKLSHPNIVTVFEVGTWNGQVYMAMELVAGPSLGEWLAAGPRSWQEVLEVFMQAGRGLAAAHASGLVHRDFKPDNAIVGEDGRVRVLDFGLARAVTDTSQELVITAAASAPLTSSVLSAPLTMTGAVMGTPAYMAPEQHRGEPADARSDQFSFCVSLYEALYGRRPFAGDDLVSLVFNVLTGVMQPPPRDRRVPGKVHAAVVRGLAVDPDARWPGMSELLAALSVDPVRRRRGIAAGVAALVIAGVVGGSVLQARGAGRCGGGEAQLESVWNDERRAEVDAALLATGLPYAGDTASRVRQELDAYAAAWVAGHRDACEATVVRQEQSEAVRDERMLCLAQRRQHLDALVDVLARADKTVVISAVEAARGLPGVDACADVRYLAAVVKPPEDPAAALQVHALEQALAVVDANGTAGRYREAEALLRPISEAASALGYAPLQVRAAWGRAWLLERMGRFAEAEAIAEQAFFDARLAGLELEASELAAMLITIVGDRLERPVEGLIWARHAFAAQRRLGDPREEARLLRARATIRLHQSDLTGAAVDIQRSIELDEQDPSPDPLRLASSARALSTLRRQQGKHAEAEALLQRAIDLRVQVLGPEHPTLAEMHTMHAKTLASLARRDEALVELELALAMHRRDGGEDHPWVGTDLQEIGSNLQAQGKMPEALDYFQRALAVHLKALGGAHPTVGTTYNLMAVGYSRMGRKAEARQHFQRALEIYRAAYGDDHADVARIYINLGVQHKLVKDYDVAAGYYARGLVLLERRLGPGHPTLGQLHGNTGNLRVEQGRLNEARDEYRRALEILEAAQGKMHPDLAGVLIGLSTVECKQGHPDEALAYAERALAIFAAVTKPDPLMVAEAELAAGQALTVGRRDLARARTLIQHAREVFVAAGPGAAQHLADLDKWVAGKR